jgi:translation initiation factor 6 (eIF-6)
MKNEISKHYFSDSCDLIESKYMQGKRYFNDLFARGEVPKCSPGYVYGACNGGHKFASVQLCGKEYCSECGKDGSPIHSRRVSRWLPKVDQFKQVGYLVITIPIELRPYFLSKERLKHFRKEFIRMLQYHNFTKGLARWHFFGDCELCKGKGCIMCNKTGSSSHYYPHLNILIEGGYMQPEELEDKKRIMQNYLVKYFKKIYSSEIEGMQRRYNSNQVIIEKETDQKEVNKLIKRQCILNDKIAILTREKKALVNDKLVINYSYCVTQKQIVNRVKYILRATFRIYNDEVKASLHNFRNAVQWGTVPVQTEKEEIYCPTCEADGIKHVIKFTKIQHITKTTKVKYYEKGIYQIDDCKSHGYGTIELAATSRTTSPGAVSQLFSKAYSSRRSAASARFGRTFS